MSVDPLAEQAPEWTPYRYGFNNPILYTDPDGRFEDKAAAKQYAKENNIKTGWFRKNKIVKQSDGSYAIENKKAHTSIANDSEFGVMTSVLVTADNPNKSVSGQIMSGTLVTAGVTSQLDGPVPGPADAVAVGEIVFGAIVAGLAYITIDQIRTTTTIADPGMGNVLYKKINGNSAANEAAREWGYEDAHDLKRDHDVGSEYDIYRDGKTGKGQLRPKKGKPGEHKEIYPKN